MDSEAQSLSQPQSGAWDRKNSLGALVMMGFEGTTVTSHIRSLIEDYRLGIVMLNATNFVSAEQAMTLIRDLQLVAHASGHEYPLMIAVDQENGIVQSLYDPRWITQFPSSLGIAATDSAANAYDVALATGRELACVGINWILGPAIDVVLDRYVPGFGSRSFGDDPAQVARLGGATVRGLRKAGVASTAKHFPLGGSLKFDESSTTVPAVVNTLEQLRQKVVIPFQEAFREDVDSVLAAGCAISSIGPKLMHGCFSRKVVTDLLRRQLGFNGVAISECLEMESIAGHIGVGQAAVMGIHAGCDVLTICQSLPLQLEAFSALSTAFDNGALSWDVVEDSVKRVRRLRARNSTWSRALNPPGLVPLAAMLPDHRVLATRVYEESITVIRDDYQYVPLTNILNENSRLLILSPLLHHRGVAPAAAHADHDDITGGEPAAASETGGDGGAPLLNTGSSHTTRRRKFSSNKGPNSSRINFDAASSSTASTTPAAAAADATNSTAAGMTAGPGGTGGAPASNSLQYGEDYFQHFGRTLAGYGTLGEVVHTSYTAHGVRTEHETQLDRADAVVLLVADANRNQYQLGFAKHLAALVQLQRAQRERRGLPATAVVIVSLSSSYDVPPDAPFPAHVCTYDSSPLALSCLARVLGGTLSPRGRVPGPQPRAAGSGAAPDGDLGGDASSTAHQQTWLVERYDAVRDRAPLERFLAALMAADELGGGFRKRGAGGRRRVVRGVSGSGSSDDEDDDNDDDDDDDNHDHGHGLHGRGVHMKTEAGGQTDHSAMRKRKASEDEDDEDDEDEDDDDHGGHGALLGFAAPAASAATPATTGMGTGTAGTALPANPVVSPAAVAERLFAACTNRRHVRAQHFVIRNTGSGAIYGFASALAFPTLRRGCLGALLVDRDRRNLSVGRDLHTSVARFLLQLPGIDALQLGAPLLALLPGLPLLPLLDRTGTADRAVLDLPASAMFFEQLGWRLRDIHHTQQLFTLTHRLARTRAAKLARLQQAVEADAGLVFATDVPGSALFQETLAFVQRQAADAPTGPAPSTLPFAGLAYEEAAGTNPGTGNGVGAAFPAASTVAVTARDWTTGAVVGAMLLLGNPRAPSGSSFFPLLHSHGREPSATTALLVFPVLATQAPVGSAWLQQHAQADGAAYQQAVGQGLAAAAVVAAQQRLGCTTVWAHTVPEPVCSALEEVGFAVDRAYVAANRPRGGG